VGKLADELRTLVLEDLSVCPTCRRPALGLRELAEEIGCDASQLSKFVRDRKGSYGLTLIEHLYAFYAGADATATTELSSSRPLTRSGPA